MSVAFFNSSFDWLYSNRHVFALFLENLLHFLLDINISLFEV